MLSLLLFTLETHDCAAVHSSNLIKFADDMTIVDLVIGINVYRKEM